MPAACSQQAGLAHAPGPGHPTGGSQSVHRPPRVFWADLCPRIPAAQVSAVPCDRRGSDPAGHSDDESLDPDPWRTVGEWGGFEDID